MQRLARLVSLALAVAATLALPARAQEAAPQKVLRYAFRTAETSFDPTQINDIYSRTVTAHIFEALYTYDHLARPSTYKPLTAEALPEASDNHRTWTMRVKPGIHFADDPVFKGAKRELVAEDYVYAIKRFADPALKSPVWSYIDGFKFLGLGELRQRAIAAKQPFDYDAPVEGLRALDKYTVQIRLAEPRPRFIEFLAASDLFGGVAREVVKAYGDKIAEHPVGTGPFRLAQWRRASFIALERNPDYRERLYDAEPAADDAEGQAILARLKGRRLPMVDRVEISIIEENQPRWLAFLNGQHNVIEQVPPEYSGLAMPNGKLAPNLAKEGVQGWRRVRADMYVTFFNLEDPLVGGYTPDKVALRRAISLGLDAAREIRLVHKGQGILAQAPIAPNTNSYDPAFKSEMSEYNPARARALLDLYGYRDRDGDGWRETPDGRPLLLQMATQPSQETRRFDELMKRDMKAIGLRIEFQAAQWPEQYKAARAGKLMMWSVSGRASSPDGIQGLLRYDGAAAGGINLSRFDLPQMNATIATLLALPDGPEREAAFDQAKRLTVAWMPYKLRTHLVQITLTQPWLVGWRRPLFWNQWFDVVDLETVP
jgi:ABC-type transport system substrate-binding protein